MRLDRNVNPDGRGKYALIHLRKLNDVPNRSKRKLCRALDFLNEHELVAWGGDNPRDQFFVLKYKDMFAADALLAYANAIKDYCDRGLTDNRIPPKTFDDLMEYHREMMAEAEAARLCNHKIPD